MLTTGILPGSITLRSIAPFILEGTGLFMIFFAAVLLATPFATRINLNFGNHTSKVKGNRSGITKFTEATTYPSLAPLPPSNPGSTIDSTSELSLLHLAYPESVNKSNEEISDAEEVCNERTPTKGSSESPDPLLSSTVIPSERYPIFDESTIVNYNSYRHKLIEETLAKQYGGDYAPGNVILNLIQLNTPDSLANVVLAKKYDGISFFDHIKLCDALANVCATPNPDIEYPDPLSHFIPRNMRRPSTSEMETETAEPSETEIIGAKPSANCTSGPTTQVYSCQRIVPRRFPEGGGRGSVASYSFAKSPFVTPANSQAPLNNSVALLAPRGATLHSVRGEDPAVGLSENSSQLSEPPLTEQLYRRDVNASPDVVSRTHVEAQDYLSRITRKKPYEISTAKNRQTARQPRIKSSLKKKCARRTADEDEYFRRNEKIADAAAKVGGDRSEQQRIFRAANITRLSALKPTIWNN
ncbi:uncharacterized protein LOC105686763 [Athalia rosae]|uniref:uncharacterized protein LOC105686763 n=1 Tax=Athalia rosae TaxID=37344 RepID=UPI002033BFB4|nr:uncharacterized protein LOC105686763 [Athalia rosae]XP_048509073.1 uncharacterized protein LOC105686763 [Athalia rosae]XP_048509074.1 uncharacterized protein LOC105686763 [Athalia rosae]